MPGSLLGLGSSKVRRSESGRSDRSDISAYSADSRNSGAKKVSFNRAVRVKKYPRRGDSNAGDDGTAEVSPEKRFWFKVYKNRHPNTDIYGSRKNKDSDDGEYGTYGKLRPIAENNDGPRSLPNLKLTTDVGVGTDSTTRNFRKGAKHSSQLPPDPPFVRPNYVKKIVNKFNDEAVIKFQHDDDYYEDEEAEKKFAHVSTSTSTTPTTTIPNGTLYRKPPEPPVDYGASENPNGTTASTPRVTSKSKRNPLVNGVKVIFGMTQLKKRDDKTSKSNLVDSKNRANLKKNVSQGTSTRDKPVMSNGISHKGPYKTSIVLADENSKKYRKTKDAATLTRQGNGNGSNWELNNNMDDKHDKRLAVIDDVERRISTQQPIEIWDSGDRLVSDRSRFESSVDKTPEGRFFRSSGEQSRIWRNEKRTVYEEESSPIIIHERRAKSHGDLRIDDKNSSTTIKPLPGKVLSSDEIYRSSNVDSKDYTITPLSGSRVNTLTNTLTKDKGIQCGPDQTEEDSKSSINRYRVIRSKDGYVSAFSDVPSLDSDEKEKYKNDSKTRTPSMTSTLKTNGTLSSDAIYSMVDKSKKKKKQAYVTPVARTASPILKNPRGYPYTAGPESTLSGSDTLKKVKQSQKGFGFRLKKAFGSSQGLDKDKGNTYTSAVEDDDNWYDVDADVAAAEKRGKDGVTAGQKSHSEPLRSEPDDDDLSSSASNDGQNKRDSTPASVIREMNHKKREISYENVPHLSASHGREIGAGSGSGLWFRDADEDYRREMAQSDVSYPSGSHVGNNGYDMTVGSSATLSRLRDKRGGSRDDLTTTPKAYTLDRKRTSSSTGKKSTGGKLDKDNKNDVKILLNGHEINDVERFTRLDKNHHHRRSQRGRKDDSIRLVSSVQSDPVHHRGGLAAAYKARQKAALKRSNSAATGSVFGSRLSVNSPSRTRRGHQSSGGSAVDSSDSDSTRRRRTLIMYIPGISHPERRASDEDKLSRVSRTQSMYSAAKPPRYQKNPNSNLKLTGSSHRINTANSDLSEEGDTITPLRSEMKRKSKSKSPGDSIGRSSGRNRDLRRRHSMPKDTKFGWLKWKIKGKPSKES